VELNAQYMELQFRFLRLWMVACTGMVRMLGDVLLLLAAIVAITLFSNVA
jgi:hypothetical protein